MHTACLLTVRVNNIGVLRHPRGAAKDGAPAKDGTPAKDDTTTAKDGTP